MNYLHDKLSIAGMAVPLLAVRQNEKTACGEYLDLIDLGLLAESWGLNLIQLLPLNDTGDLPSPYAALSAFALHPIHLSLQAAPETLAARGVSLSAAEKAVLSEAHEDLATRYASAGRVPFGQVLAGKLEAFRKVWNACREGLMPQVERFAEEQAWAKPYAAFMTLKQRYALAPWWEWPEFRNPSPSDIEALWQAPDSGEEMRFRIFLQVLARDQLEAAAQAVHARGIDIMGDIPILLAPDSADVWFQRAMFRLDRQAGSPPDWPGHMGQNWGFPLYNWSAPGNITLDFWRRRLAYAANFYSAYRIDHVLGFFRIWTIDTREREAVLGYFEPYGRISHHGLAALGFSEERLVWLSRPHISEERLQAVEETCSRRTADPPAMRARLAALREQLFIRVKQEPLFQFYPDIHGTMDIEAICRKAGSGIPGEQDALHEYIDALSGWWFDRTLQETEPGQYVFRWFFRDTTAWHTLDEREKNILEDAARRLEEEAHREWEQQGRHILDLMVHASDMQAFAEDLGAIPPCVPRVLKELGIPGLRVFRWQRQWDAPGMPYHDPGSYDSLSLACTSVHDSSSMREWWEKEADRNQLWQLCVDVAEKDAPLAALMAEAGEEPPARLTPEAARLLVRLLATSSSMVAMYPIQDILACEGRYHLQTPEEERINVPGTVSDANWTWHMPVSLLALKEDKPLAGLVSSIVKRG
ncbi:MAG: 4-alpha-glucanotransferase [Spirochaetaceae bacterium]|nr:4-alpha-glucanotransferase [Spirochaetaceae bacterium]